MIIRTTLPGFELENNLELASPKSFANELITVPVSLVSPKLKVSEETLNCLFEHHVMEGKVVVLEVILNI